MTSSDRRSAAYGHPWVVGGTVIVIDHALKLWVTKALPYGRSIVLLPRMLHVAWRTNWRYIAGAKRWGLSPLGNGLIMGVGMLAVLVACLLYHRRSGVYRTWAMLAAMSFLVGLCSHLVDLCIHSSIVDYLWSPLLGGWSFDLGDLALLVGGGCAVLESVISPLSPAAACRAAEERSVDASNLP